MSLRREIGQVLAWTRNDSCYAFHPTEFPRLKTEWTRGAAFFTGTSLSGSETTIKLATVEAILLATPESIANADRMDEEERNDDMLAGRV